METLQTAFGKWKPEEGLNVLAFMGTLDGGDGYVLVEADDPKIITSFVTKFIHWNDVEVIPVLDISEVVAISGPNIGWARTASKG